MITWNTIEDACGVLREDTFPQQFEDVVLIRDTGNELQAACLTFRESLDGGFEDIWRDLMGDEYLVRSGDQWIYLRDLLK